MINVSELRLGNVVLYKKENRIIRIALDFQHFELLGKGGMNLFFPVSLKADQLEKCGFVENKKYALLPQAHEYILTLPVIGTNKNEIYAWIKNNGECFARLSVNGAVASNNIYHLHQLQNLCFAVTGEEMTMK